VRARRDAVPARCCSERVQREVVVRAAPEQDVRIACELTFAQHRESKLAQRRLAQSRPELFNRMEVAGEAIERAAKDFDNEDAPEEFRQQHGELVNALQLLATDLGATASDLRNYPELLDGTSALQFEGWTKANRALRELADRGIEVRPIESR
jgi:hypothetical protein